MMEDVVSRVHKRLKATGKTARSASLEAGLSEDAIRNMERAARSKARRGISTNTITVLAPVLQTSVAWLLGDTDEENPDAETTLVPLIGHVSVGAVVITEPVGGYLRMVPAPDGSTSNTVAAQIIGDSYGAVFADWLVYWNDTREPVTPELYGELCVVGLPDGRTLVRQLRPAGEGLYHLISNLEAPMLDQQVEWAARVIHMKPGK